MDHHPLAERRFRFRIRRRARLFGAVPLLVAGVTGVAGVAGVTACSSDSSGSDSADLKSFRTQYKGQCASLAGEGSAAQLARIVPDARTFGISAGKARCVVKADGKRAVTLAVEPARGKEDWQADVVAGVKWGSDQERLDKFGGGYVSGSAAALYVPCPGKRARSVLVTSPPGGHHKKDLATLAERTAARSVKRAGC
ncbi:hypothetical protein GCM10009801_03740 [Streptomyces albiaxialis]|uniref:Lipoprotein n=1 Tax=Streptomyces albiaxialis TaxID=329523 RepID=A0ABN2VFT3_9ACTN